MQVLVKPRAALAALALSVLVCTSGCGGGGGGGASAPVGGGPVTPPPAGSGDPAWVANSYSPSNTFINRCATVRTGVDIEGNPFPDRPGSVAFEKFYLRSWTQETYLWNDEVLDRNPDTIAAVLDYFAVLRTTARTPSGRQKDEFHFSQPTAQYLADRNAAPRSTYGASYLAARTTVPRDFRIRYTEPNSPAAQIVNGLVNLPRGARILFIDGIDLINASTQGEIDSLNRALFPATAGEQHTFVIQEAGSDVQRTVTLTSANLAPVPVNRTAVVNTQSGAVGYLLLTTFSPFSTEAGLASAITSLRNSNVSDLVLDLRYNGGGLLAIASQLSYMIAGPTRTAGKTFERLRFNVAAGNTNPVTGGANNPTPFYTTGLGFSLANGAPLPTLNLPRVFVLTTDDTCSASESVINGLRGADVEVILVGSTTCGKPYGFYPASNCGQTYYSIQFQGVNHRNFGDYADGFAPANSSDTFAVKAPGCFGADDLTRELGDQTEGLFSTALQFRANGVCPPGAQQQQQAIAGAGGFGGSGGSGLALLATNLSPVQQMRAQSRDMSMP
jgi:hypothetical protein